jgi:hypothetical protein
MPPARAEPLDFAWIPDLSRFLLAGLDGKPGHDAFAAPEVLRWKYQPPVAGHPGPLSFVLRDGDTLAGHIGFHPTAFTVLGRGETAPTPALHSMDWLVTRTQGGPGALLMMEAFSRSRVQYALGCSPSARRALLGGGFRIGTEVPLYHRVLRPLAPAVWREIHGHPSLPRRAALLAADFPRAWRSPPPFPAGLRLEPVSAFGTEVEAILARFPTPLLLTSRAPGVLNHFLVHPHGVFSGWKLSDESGPRGFALLSVIERPGLRLGRVVECFLDTPDPAAWAGALGLLLAEARARGCHLVSTLASTPWMTAGLQANRAFRRGRIPFYLRDPRRLLPTDLPLHITHLEADAGYT